ncbi:MaoC family dehydratase N-terminal domain-containing protein [Puniceibacterium sp. IMCC21224]|uniref:FAS1-like dehydratase domain-containing protein n=1 Tax=Puniceibacterium sp. IMCC21224 TaxID=1618204 RepID=UPI00064DE90C|nr:MaoC family dehydratase N-terminal domain-containing protein [Puniceibacterium sp. IMCC21224]KMK65517.1 hypothetical protein IMCC21224_11349 [Puniceibacterium sp. IMCC21224]
MQSDSPPEMRQTDAMDPARACALLAALGLPDDVRVGAALPPFFHQLYFWDPQPPAALGRDGHPRIGSGLIPDMGLPRRMWAGGVLEFLAPLRAGLPATRVSRLAGAEHKNGRSGPLTFVTLVHEIEQDDVCVLRETQDLVYRQNPDPATLPPTALVARQDETRAEQMTFDSTLLFRYSALTFNGHRIHYDEAYAREVEGYSGLVVHGPLLAQLLMLRAPQPLRRFRFRATAPLMHWETATLCFSGQEAWVRGPDGRQCMTASYET